MKTVISWEVVKDNTDISGLENWVRIIGGGGGLKTKNTISLYRKIF